MWKPKLKRWVYCTVVHKLLRQVYQEGVRNGKESMFTGIFYDHNSSRRIDDAWCGQYPAWVRGNEPVPEYIYEKFFKEHEVNMEERRKEMTMIAYRPCDLIEELTDA